MTTEATQAQAQPKPRTEADIQNDMKAAMGKNDWGAVKKLAAELDKLEKAEQAAKKAALQQRLETMVKQVQGVIKKALEPLMFTADKNGEIPLAGADGVWVSWDFGDSEPSIRLLKSTKAAGSTGAGKSSYIAGFPPNKDMLELVGKEIMFAEGTTVTIDKQEYEMKAGTTYQEAHDYSTNGGWRNRVRMALGKAYTKAVES